MKDYPFIAKNIAAFAAARAVERSGVLLRSLRWLPLPARSWIVFRLRNPKLPAEAITRHGPITFKLNLADELQRWIYFGVYERKELSRALALIPRGGVCVDVGANIGYFSLHFAHRVGPEGAVYAFEPEPRNYDLLLRNRAENRCGGVVQAHQIALGATEGRAAFYTNSSSNSGLGSLVDYGRCDSVQTSIRVMRLDDFLSSRGVRQVDLMKVDIEGHEFEMLEGARTSLRAGVFRHVLIEWNGVLMRQRGRTRTEFLSLFEDCGYCLSEDSSAEVRQARDETSLNLLFSRGERISP